MGWQPSPFLSDRAQAERAFALAEQLGSVTAAAELGTTWPSLRKAFTHHGLGMPARNPQAVRQRTIDAAPPADGQAGGGSGGPGVCGAQPRRYPIRARSDGEPAERVRRAEDYAVLGAEVVVELNNESRADKRSTRAWAITRRAERAERLADHRRGRPAGRDAARIGRADRTSRSHAPVERGIPADAR